MSFNILTGRDSKHTKEFAEGLRVHESMIKEIYRLQDAAKKEGIQIEIASGFRDFQRQLKIWNLKASGERKLRDRNEIEIDFNTASKREVLESILTWSALPGASRHHWGTEIDIFDKSVKERDKVELTQKECEEDFPKLYEWLESNLDRFDFHRPYRKDLGGVAREPWHLSYTPISTNFERDYTIDVLRKSVKESEMLIKDEVISSLDWIFANFIKNVSPA